MSRWFSFPRLCSLAATALVLAIPAPSSAQPSAPDDPAQWTTAQRASFDASFAKSVHDSCMTSAQGHGAQTDAAERYCSCVVGKLAPLSVEEKMALKSHQDTLVAASNACKSQ
jgi:hypothetical protein